MQSALLHIYPRLPIPLGWAVRRGPAVSYSPERRSSPDPPRPPLAAASRDRRGMDHGVVSVRGRRMKSENSTYHMSLYTRQGDVYFLARRAGGASAHLSHIDSRTHTLTAATFELSGMHARFPMTTVRPHAKLDRSPQRSPRQPASPPAALSTSHPRTR